MTTIEEDGVCPNCLEGRMVYPKVNCSCHINPPCSACVNNVLTCSVCGFSEEDTED